MPDERKRDSLAAIAPINHDFRQPLQSLALLHSSLSARPLNPEDQEIVASMGHAIESMIGMFDSLMIAARLDAGTLAPVMGPVPLGPVMEDSASAFREAAARKGIEIRTVPAKLNILSNSDLLVQLVQALVSNAIAFSEGGRVLLGVRRRGTLARVEIWDTGLGVPADRAARIFDRFYTDDLTLHGRAPHIGLGLSIAHELAALMGHELTMQSWPGRGSVFCLSGSIADPECEAPDDAAVTARRGGLAGKTIAFAGHRGTLEPVARLFERWQACALRLDGPDSLAGALARGAPDPSLIVLGAGGRADINGLCEAVARSGRNIPVMIVAPDTGLEPGSAPYTDGVHVIRMPLNPGRIRALAEHLVAGAN